MLVQPSRLRKDSYDSAQQFVELPIEIAEFICAGRSRCNRFAKAEQQCITGRDSDVPSAEPTDHFPQQLATKTFDMVAHQCPLTPTGI